MRSLFLATLVALCALNSSAFANDLVDIEALSSIDFDQPDYDEEQFLESMRPMACRRANSTQLAEVNRGFAKLQKFLAACATATSGSTWCNEIVRPNPASASIFHCTYGSTQPHNLIHPDENTWSNAFKAIRLVQELEVLNLKPCIIYNWWRPEPYNANVGGAPGRHPFGTSIDVRFCSMADMENAHSKLCEWRKQGRLRALGYYGTTALHFGIGDSSGNTWGKSCP